MPESIKIIDILAKIQALLETLPNPGLILTHESFVNNDEQFYDLFIGHQETDEGHGVLVSYIGFTQKEDGPFRVIVRHKFAIEFLLPYKTQPIDGRNSHQRFEEDMVTPARQILNLTENRNLGYGSLVRHELLQSEVDWLVKRWSGGSASKKLTHYAPTEIAVNVSERAC